VTAGRESGLVQHLRRALEAAAFGSRQHVLVGVSGGADSLALIVGLHELDRLGLLHVTAVHVDHGVRETSHDEARQVAALLDRLGIACVVRTIVPDDLARHRGVGAEEALRRERYRAFAEVLTEIGAEVVATAHHQRDQAETVLLHLLRGAGLDGVSGMRVRSALTVPWWPNDALASRAVALWRPVLDVDPAELRAFVAARGLPIIEDASNADPTYRRNAIRHEVLPVLERVMPGATVNLARFAANAQADDDVIDGIVTALLSGRDGREGLPWRELREQAIGIQRRVIRRWVLTQISGLELTQDRTEAVRQLAERNEGGKRVEIGEGWSVTVRGGMLRLVR